MADPIDVAGFLAENKETILEHWDVFLLFGVIVFGFGWGSAFIVFRFKNRDIPDRKELIEQKKDLRKRLKKQADAINQLQIENKKLKTQIRDLTTSEQLIKGAYSSSKSNIGSIINVALKSNDT